MANPDAELPPMLRKVAVINVAGVLKRAAYA
jgi:hypothetical protein